MAIKILEVEQNTEEWLELRKNKVTGSIADNLLTRGLDEALKENYREFRGNFYTQRGHILEDEAIEVYEAIHDCTVARVGFVVNDKWPNAGCSPDGIDGDYLLEVKCFGEKKHLDLKKHSDIPFKVMAQLQFNMMISGKKRARLVLYNPDIADDERAYHEIEVGANVGVWKNLAAKLEAK